MKRNNKPKLQTDSDGNKFWYLNGELHRTDGPAIEYANGDKFWYKNGKYHREDGPAVEYAIGSKYWYLNGKRHRTDGPACEYANGNKYWYLNDKLHRIDGPAIEYADGTKEWYLNGKRDTETKFKKGKQMTTITKDEAVQKIKDSNGRIFTVTFVKKTDGQTRKMNCRLGVKKNLKGTGRSIDPKKFIGVYDLQKDDYRVINIEGIQELKIKGQEYVIVDSLTTTKVTIPTPTMEYSVAEGKDIQDLKTEVRSYISKGWKPLGGITLGVDTKFSFSYTPRYLQVMIKE